MASSPTRGLLASTRRTTTAGPWRTATDLARVLQVIVGEDRSDPRQSAGTPSANCLRAVEQAPDDLRGARIGIVTEGFSERIGVQSEVADAVAGAIDRFRPLGAELREVSIPENFLGEPSHSGAVGRVWRPLSPAAATATTGRANTGQNCRRRSSRASRHSQ
jgi:Asp-tRNA(Asn)/Glu-tRNA(Gln) amidotransferase A subunit family amidase